MQRIFFLLFLIHSIHLNLWCLGTQSKEFMKTLDPQNTIFLIDGSGFLYRAYYGLRPLHTKAGVPVQAVYSFCRMIKKLAETFKPEYMALVWDSKGITVRHELYPAYKATRQAPPNDLFDQKRLIQEFAESIGLHQFEQPGVEADDLLFSLAQDYQKQGSTIVLVTSDKDMAQALNDSVTIYDPLKQEWIDARSFQDKMGFPVHKLPFYFALLGDTSDNIPGVKGVGKKGATDLITQFDSLVDLYQHLDQVKKEKTREALQENRQNAFLSEQLFVLRYYPVDSQKELVAFDLSNWKHAQPLFQELEFKSLVTDIEKKEGTQTEELPFLSKEKGYLFTTVTTPEQLLALCQRIEQKKIVAIDTELDGLDPLINEVVGICLSVEKGFAYYVPFGHHVPTLQLSKQEVFDALKPLFENPDIAKVMHHAKFDMMALWHYGIKTENLTFDTLIAAHLVTKDWQKIGLKGLSEFYLHEPMLSFGQVVANNKYKNFAFVPLDLATEYAACDAHQTLQLHAILEQELLNHDMRSLYDTIEHPLISVLFDMEREGISLDVNLLKELDSQVIVDLELIKNEIIALVGQEFQDINLNSPKQLEQLLFVHLKLPPQKKSGKRTGYSTDVEVLQELSQLHPVPALMVKYRELYKLKSTYIDALPTYINPHTGKIHTHFSQTAVATGRLASSDPNLQNIPVSTGYDIHIRQAFTPQPGHLFLSADYSQIELRVLAQLSRDNTLINAFLNNVDIHAQTASKLFDVPLRQVSNEQRQIGKRINFSILYGLTPYGLSKDLNIPFKDAKQYIEKYFAQYPGVQTWMDHTIEQAKELGYVTTLWGRRRYVPGIYERNRMLYDLAKRIAINTVAQGTAAEIMKIGMIQLHHALKERNLGAKLIIQIHDELLLSVPEHEQKETEQLVQQTLENVVQWTIPLVVTTRFGRNWQEVTK